MLINTRGQNDGGKGMVPYQTKRVKSLKTIVGGKEISADGRTGLSVLKEKSLNMGRVRQSGVKVHSHQNFSEE